MLKEVFMVAVGISLVGLVAHSCMKYGWRDAVEFFGLALLFGFVREFFMETLLHRYTEMLTFQVLGVPLFILLGWTWMWYLTRELLRKLVPFGENFALCAAYFSGFICVPIETAALLAGWWVLAPDWMSPDLFCPVPLVGGWWSATMGFFYLYFGVKRLISVKKVVLAEAAIFLTFSAILYQPLGWFLLITGLFFTLLIRYQLLLASLGSLSMEILLIILPNWVVVIISFGIEMALLIVIIRYSQKEALRAKKISKFLPKPEKT